MEMNSGQRSQYNPHSQQSNRRENDNNNERNSSNNSSQEVDRGCVMHCFLENLHMVCTKTCRCVNFIFLASGFLTEEP